MALIAMDVLAKMPAMDVPAVKIFMVRKTLEKCQHHKIGY